MMKVIYNDIEKLQLANTVISIGTFDGVHLGHRKVLNHLVEKAQKTACESIVLTFEPHPRIILNPNDYPIRLLTTFEEKIKLLSELGINYLIVLNFTRKFSKTSYEDFVKNILVDKLKIRTLVVGYDNKFGRNRWGSFEKFLEMSEKIDFDVERVDALSTKTNENISSTKIREILSLKGDVEKAAKYLGYPFSFEGKTVVGERYGRRIGFPTANLILQNPHKIIPAIGVYAITIQHKSDTYKGMINIGFRPTISQQRQLSVEAHIFDFDKDIYGEILKINFYFRIRDEIKFESRDVLNKQLNKDKVIASRLLQDILI